MDNGMKVEGRDAEHEEIEYKDYLKVEWKTRRYERRNEGDE